MANVWANQRGTRVIAATDITDHSVEEYAAHNLVIDDIPTLLGDASREATLFHIHNLCLANGNALLMTGTGDVATWTCALPDLASRLNGTRTARLDPPDDMLFQALLAKLFGNGRLALFSAAPGRTRWFGASAHRGSRQGIGHRYRWREPAARARGWSPCP